MPIDLARRLHEEGLITEEQLLAVVVRRASSGEPVPVALHSLRLASEEAIAAIFDRMGFAPATRLKPIAPAKDLPKGMLRAFWALPIGESPTGYVVAMADPTDGHVLAELAHHLRRPVDPRVAPLEKLRDVLMKLDPPTRSSSTRGRTLRAAAPPAASDDDDLPPMPKTPRLPAAASDGVLDLARRPIHRRNTPAYGERAAVALAAGIPALGKVETKPAAPRVGESASAIGAYVAPAAPAGPETPATPSPAPGESQFPIPLKRKPSAAKHARADSRPLPRDAIYTLAELRQAGDRDAIGRIAARGLLSVGRRAAFFVVKRGVVQGWEGATVEGSEVAGLSREALRNLWIPVTTPSVFRLVSEKGGVYVGPLSESTADSILAAALGGRPGAVMVAPIEVRGHVVAFLYADTLSNGKDAEHRVAEIVGGAAEALERWIVSGRQGR